MFWLSGYQSSFGCQNCQDKGSISIFVFFLQIPSRRELFPDAVEVVEQEGPADLSVKSSLKRELSSSSSIDHDYYSFTPCKSIFILVWPSWLDWLFFVLQGFQENKTPSSVHTPMFGPPKISRKQKSLGLLCEKFIKRYPEAVKEGVKCEIPLDDLAKSMSTERRRIYDIVNVLEAVQMMTKVDFKASYQSDWKKWFLYWTFRLLSFHLRHFAYTVSATT